MHQLTWLGVALILIGVALVLFPILGKYIDFSGAVLADLQKHGEKAPDFNRGDESSNRVSVMLFHQLG